MEAYKASAGLGATAIILLACQATGNLVGLLGHAMWRFDPSYLEGNREAEPLDRVFIACADVIDAIQLPLFILTAIFFLAWLYRAYANLSAMVPTHNMSPKWAVAGWFIPVFNLMHGYRSVNLLWLDSAADPESPGWKIGPRSSFLVGIWWSAYLLHGVAFNFLSGPRRAATVQGWVDASNRLIFLFLLDILAAALCIFIVVTLERRLQAIHRAQSQRAS